VSLLILSDHNTVKGSLEAANKIKSRDLNIICPPAAEYKTEFGDVILVGLNKDLKMHKFHDLIRASIDNDCKLLLPHPYHDHSNIEYLANNVDYIEIFNSRNSLQDNKKAFELAIKTKKKTFASPDAHLLSEYAYCIVEYSCDVQSRWFEIIDCDWRFKTKIKTSKSNIYKSALIKSLKHKSLINTFKSLVRICILFFTRNDRCKKID